MKKLSFMIFIFLTLIFVCVFEQVITNKYFFDIQNQAKKIEVLSYDINNLDYKNIKLEVEDINNKWDKYENVLSIFFNHKDMMDLCIELKQLKGHLKAKNYENFISSLQVVIHLIDDYKKMFVISFFNLI